MAASSINEFSTDNFSILFELLVDNAYKWELLGIALSFKPQDLNNIKASLESLHEASRSHMRTLLEEWLEGKHPHAKSPTLENLCNALASKTVGLGALSRSIRKKLSEDNLISKDVFEIASISNEGKVVCTRGEDIVIKENTSVSLSVKTASETCRWRSSGLVSIEDKMYTNTKKRIMDIHKADIDVDDCKYFCKIQQNDGNLIEVGPVTLRVKCFALDKFKESLEAAYKHKHKLLAERSWPPVKNKVYINLALIKRQTGNYGGKDTHHTLQRGVDHILRGKEIIQYEHIFDGLRSGSLLLIEGRPGCGKTTLVHKIYRDWVDTELLGPVRLLLLVPLRRLNNLSKPLSLATILQLFDLEQIEEVLKNRKGKGVCFIFDGLDEFSPTEENKSTVHKIIGKECLPESIVVVASRPAALVNLKDAADKVIEVIGFTRDLLDKYIESYPFSENSKARALISYIDDHPNVQHMCYLPIHAVMISFLFDVTGKIPRTETEIYNNFTIFTLMRSCTKHKDLGDMRTAKLNGDERDQFQRICKLADLDTEEREHFEAICKLALEITAQNKQVLDEEDMTFHMREIKRKDSSLGLVTVDRTVGLFGFKNTYSFLHLTYQEYLAALHISKLSHEEQCDLINEHASKKHMQVVWKFYCGLVRFEEDQIKALFGGRENLLLFHIHCAYESQQEQFCNFLMKHASGHILISNRYLSTTDFTALGYFLTNTSQPASLSLYKCNIEEQGAKVLLSETKERPLLLHSLIYESEQVALDSLKLLLVHQSSLNILKFKRIVENHSEKSSLISPDSLPSLDDIGFPDVIRTSLATLKEMEMDRIPVGSRSLSYLLQICRELKSLTLNHSIDERDIENLLEGISHSKIENLSCNIGRVSITISRNPTLQFDRLFIQGDKSGKKLVLKINGTICSVFVKYCCEYFDTLQVLKLHTPRGEIEQPVASIRDFNFNALTELALWHMRIDKSEAETLAEKLHSCDMLKDVQLVNDVIGKHGVSKILTSLKNCRNLQNLVLNETCIKSSGAQTLASCLQHWPKLQQLHLRECDIDKEGAMAIAKSLQKNFMNIEIEFIGNPVEHETLQILSSAVARCHEYQPASRKKKKSRPCKIS